MFPRSKQGKSDKCDKVKPSLITSDAQIIYQMLQFCSGELRTDSQIMSYCHINQKEFFRFLEHCYNRGLLKPVLSEGLPRLVNTERGDGILVVTETIIKELGTCDQN